MISDGVSDLLNGLIKMAYEKDETKKVTNPYLVYFDAQTRVSCPMNN